MCSRYKSTDNVMLLDVVVTDKTLIWLTEHTQPRILINECFKDDNDIKGHMKSMYSKRN